MDYVAHLKRKMTQEEIDAALMAKMEADERTIADLSARLSAAEKERDEAKRDLEFQTNARLLDIQDFNGKIRALAAERNESLAWGEKLKEALELATSKLPWATAFTDDEEIFVDEALSTPAPAALSHLRQEIRREALEEAAKECDERARIESAKAQQCRDRKEIAWAQMYDQNADQARLMAQDLRRLAEEQEGKNERV